ncbi:MAG: protein kinase, partial [Armatimonadota bacterium]
MSEITERLTTAIADRYRIERELGAGGMATVYLAHDVKHDRKVALKVLRPELAAVIGAERFLNEIKVTANLQHPHILPLHDSGEADTFLYYVMPYVEGETLREKIDREKQLGVTEAIEVTRSVAAALDYAHRQNVIHRDIKPENILIHDGQALVADFGIALAVSQAGGTRLTETGLSVGTPHYMSPEQAMGDRELDARSDVYSLGAVLYEMLAGDPPYTGSTAQAIVAKVITEKAPPVTVHRDTVPPHVAAAIQKALSKLPADRFHSAAEFADALTKPGAVPTVPRDVPAEAVPAPARAIAIPIPSARAVLPWALLAVAAGVAVWALLRPPPHAQVARFQVGMPEDAGLLTATNGRTIALSPDGGTIVYVGPSRQLFARRLDQLAVRPLPGTRGAHTPFFSPDGAWVGFYASPSLKRVALAGGPPLTIANAPTMRGASWGTDDYIVFAPSIATGLMRVAAAGGPVDTLTRPDQGRGETSHRWPRV